MGILDDLRAGPQEAGDDDARAAATAPAGAYTAPARESLRQRLRLRRFLQASAFSLLYLGVLAIFASVGKVDSRTLLQACVIVLAAIGLFFVLFRSGANRRFADPSLTRYQVLAAVSTMLFVAYHAPETRTVFGAFFFVALMFGMLGARSRSLAILGTASLAGFAAVSLLRYHVDGNGGTLREDMLQLLVTAVAFPWLVFLGSSVKRLQEADRRKDDFLATLAHELRNPLAPIRTGIQILGMRAGAAQAERVLPMMERQVAHLARLLDDLLDVSRITRGKIALRIERVALADVVQAAVEASRPHIEAMEQALEVSLPAQPVMLDADPVRLAQVVSNLLNNATRYTPRGGRIELAARAEGPTVTIRVRDDGVGIPPERLGSIFEMFAQSGRDAATPAGLGIGLALARALVTLHGGTIDAHSEGHGRGSEFRVRLPIARGVAAPTGGASVQRRVARQKVLVVDDNPDVAASLATLLDIMGHEVRIASDGEAALRIAGEWQPDLVLLDLGLPGIDGLETCRRMRAAPSGGAMRIVAVTGWGQDEDRRRSAAAGFDEHLVKPVDASVLAALLARAS